MSVCAQAKRTLVKSPPELWAELSDPASLARHLGELGEIHIVRTDPERSVEWEATEISGTVLIEPSGWGTKVTLTATQTLALPEPATEPAAIDGAPGHEPAREPEPMAVEAIPEPEPAPEPEPNATEAVPELTVELEPGLEPAAATPEPRRGFFARLFGRRTGRRDYERPPGPDMTLEPTRMAVEGPAAGEPLAGKPAALGQACNEPELEPHPIRYAPQADWPPADLEVAIEPTEPAAPETPAAPEAPAAPETPATPDTPAPDMSVELAAAEQLAASQEAAAEQVTAVLISVLDRLGAAHHRPFSRA